MRRRLASVLLALGVAASVVGVVYVRSTPDTSSRYDVDATAAGLRATARVPLIMKISRGTADNPPAGELLDVTHLGSGGRVSEGRGWLWFFAYNGEARERYNVLYRYYDRIGGGEGDFHRRGSQVARTSPSQRRHRRACWPSYATLYGAPERVSQAASVTDTRIRASARRNTG